MDRWVYDVHTFIIRSLVAIYNSKKSHKFQVRVSQDMKVGTDIGEGGYQFSKYFLTCESL